ncbi:hypothetical protein OG921_24120 [Aldersonia sp. NBC_00410]|uniref:hypothetical protein n=1 Tax=Aldersonia sp. NBC_00410 TaxID=2975954 RepID=UPI0022591DDD|nr:hypothetical protein [Aldersonia sp. NBC_00410]MCX5046262.1 hypothetical protein [Aldersonia sp. NBC_00410]
MRLDGLRRRFALLPEGEWDFEASLAHQIGGRFVGWMNANPWRRRIGWPLLITELLLVLATTFAPEAAAATTATGVSWTGVTDSYSVPASSYMFSTNHGSTFNPFGDSGQSTILQMQFGLYLVITVSAVWFISYAMSFNWIGFFAKPLQEISASMNHSLIVPGMLLACASIGGLYVGFQFLRGNISRGAIHIASIMLLAVLGTTIFAHPLEQVLSPDGPVAAARDVGVTISAAVTSNNDTDPKTMTKTLQANLTDNFIRHPLQVWNFGEVIDYQSPMCAKPWSDAMKTGDEDRVKDSMRDCGSPTSARMKSMADHPNGGQIGTGFLLILFAILLLAFGVKFGGKIIERFLQAAGMALLAYPSFAVSQIPGAPQVLYLRCIADALMAALSMVSYIVLLGVYALGLRSAFDASRENGIAVIFIGALLMVLGVRAVKMVGHALENAGRRLTSGLSKATGNTPGPVHKIGPGHTSHHLRNIATTAAVVASPPARAALAAIRVVPHALPNRAGKTPAAHPASTSHHAPTTPPTQPNDTGEKTSALPAITTYTHTLADRSGLKHAFGTRTVSTPTDPKHPAHPDNTAHLTRQATAARELASSSSHTPAPAVPANANAHTDTPRPFTPPAPPPTDDAPPPTAGGALHAAPPAPQQHPATPAPLPFHTLPGPVHTAPQHRADPPRPTPADGDKPVSPALRGPTPFTRRPLAAAEPRPVRRPPPGLSASSNN